MESKEDNALWDNQEYIHHEDNEEDFNQTIHSSKIIKDINKVIKVTKATHCSRILIKVTRGLHREELNNEAILEASQTSEDTQTDLVTHWTLATMS